jgi:enediyne biosynthesis protein E4
MRKVSLYVFFILIAAMLEQCKPEYTDAVFKKVAADKTGIDFANKLQYNDSLTVLDFEYMYNGAGVALIDINNDGLQDVLFTGNMVSAKLYLNKGNLKFEDITEKSGIKTEGWCYGASVVDINQDGYKDIYICKAGNRKTQPAQMHNYFFINNGNNTFTNAAAKMGLDDDGYDVQAAFFDYDKDGDLDMYLLRNAFVDYNRNNVRLKETDGNAKSNDQLFRNDGSLHFVNVSKESGITIEGFGLGVAICDINQDNWPDVYVSNDFLTNDLIWVNNKNGTFTNQAKKYLRHQTYNSMGNDVADFNNDGNEDIVEVDMLPPDNKRWKLTIQGNRWDEFFNSVNVGYEPQYVRNTLQLNNGNGTFSEIGQLAGINATEWSWAPLFADYDNDGWKDLFIANGYKEDVTNMDFILYGKRALFMGTSEANRKERLEMLKKYPGIYVPNYVFKNNGDLTFTDVSKQWGFSEPTYSNGAAYGDLDNDGDLDLVINNLDDVASVYENQTNKLKPDNKWLKINFKGPQGNRDGLETKVWLWQGESLQYNFSSPCRGYLSSVESGLHFGLQNKPVDSIKVLWPDGKSQIIKNPATNMVLTLEYKNAVDSFSIKNENSKNLLFTAVDSVYQINYQHKEDSYIDFKAQPILPHLHSHNGPGIAVGDVNGDKLDDFFTGAATGFDGSIFIQQKNGKFISQPMPHDNHSDDMGALFFDADGDGDNDLYVVSGGATEAKKGNAIYQNRLYINDGRGKFTLTTAALPVMNNSGASVSAADYDHDGDLDLFITGRVSPGEYPISPKSFLLKNESANGIAKFKDADLLPQQGNLGMVSSALWSDYDNDGWQDLILVGEFMPVTFIKNNQGKGFNAPVTIDHSQGWWNSLVAGDFDKDGDIDYIAGNQGLNNWLKASSKEPVCVYAKDYDKNGRIDPLLCHYSDGKEYIVHSRDDINTQMTPMKARFRDYTAYAEVTFKDAFLKDEIQDAVVLRCETFASAYIENEGNGKFKITNLSAEAQFSPIYGMITEDINQDGNLDVVCAGNSASGEVQNGIYDAQGILVLLGDGKGNFKADRKQLNTPSDNKAISRLQSADGSSLFLISANSGNLAAYRLQNKAKQQVDLMPDDVYALVTNKNAKITKHEFYFGHSYLSQSSRTLSIQPDVISVIIFNTKGNKRELKF